MNEGFEKMLDEIEKRETANAAVKGILHKAGKGMMKICSYVTPFLKVFPDGWGKRIGGTDSDVP
jgi:hypothetical protein